MSDQPHMPNDNENINELPPEDDAIHLPPPDELPETYNEEIPASDYETDIDESVQEIPVSVNENVPHDQSDDRMNERLERLGGEPAPDITPEEFARLRQSGQIHIDPRGRVRSHRRSVNDAGVSLRKRRAWYMRN